MLSYANRGPKDYQTHQNPKKRAAKHCIKNGNFPAPLEEAKSPCQVPTVLLVAWLILEGFLGESVWAYRGRAEAKKFWGNGAPEGETWLRKWIFTWPGEVSKAKQNQQTKPWKAAYGRNIFYSEAVQFFL